jgi:hypothetical protein
MQSWSVANISSNSAGVRGKEGSPAMLAMAANPVAYVNCIPPLRNFNRLCRNRPSPKVWVPPCRAFGMTEKVSGKRPIAGCRMMHRPKRHGFMPICIARKGTPAMRLIGMPGPVGQNPRRRWKKSGRILPVNYLKSSPEVNPSCDRCSRIRVRRYRELPP